MEIVGQWGPCLVHESYFIAEHYVAVVATGGTGSPNNVIGLRSHSNPNYQGLRQIAGAAPYTPCRRATRRTVSVPACAIAGQGVLQVTDAPGYTVPEINV